MAKDYKLCPKCNNALDLNVSKCPYCWESMWINFWFEKNWYSVSTDTLPKQTKDSKWCYIIFLIFFILPFIWSVISIIWGLISSWLDH